MDTSESVAYGGVTTFVACSLLAVAIIGGAIAMFRSSVPEDLANFDPLSEVARGAQPGEPPGDAFAAARRQMVEQQLRGRDITDHRVLAVMGQVPRERFVPAPIRKYAYEDHPLPIGLGQTISQPYIVALMTQLARPMPNDRVLEVGVGSGYQAAILAGLSKRVYGVEILAPLATAARERLVSLGCTNVTLRSGDGYQGWPEHAPFDVIVVSAAPDRVPPPLIDQLAPGGRLVIPVGRYSQDLVLIEKRRDGTLSRSSVAPVQFVPMTGEAEKSHAH
jgi:protein-L-isoaspartate(D-aspartate) O-methyltransferase